MAQEEFKHIIRIVNTDLDGKKHISIGLRKIKGVGLNLANAICLLANVDKNKKVGYLTNEDIQKIEEVLKNPAKFNIPPWMLNRRKDYENSADKHILTTDLDFIKGNDIKRMRMIKCYKGSRHASGLPLRGQRTQSNFRKNKGKVTGVKRKRGKGGRA